LFYMFIIERESGRMNPPTQKEGSEGQFGPGFFPCLLDANQLVASGTHRRQDSGPG